MSKFAHLTPIWVEEYKKGDSYRQIAEKHGVSKATVKRNVEPYITQRPRSTTDDLVPLWGQLYEEGWTMTAIAEKYHVSTSTVLRRLIESGIHQTSKSTRPSKYEKYLNEWVELYQEKGHSLTEIAKRYSCSVQTVSNIITRKIETRSYSESSRKYSLNESYFSTIDSKEKAYWLGYLYASGSVIKQINAFAIQIACAKKDENQIIRFLQAISSNAPIKQRSDNLVLTRLFSGTMYKDLVKWGLVSNKLYLLRMPTLDSPELTRSFILGYVDGKGFLVKNRPAVLISGPREFLEDLRIYIERELGFSLHISTRHQKEHGYNRHNIGCHSKYKALLLLDWLYQDQLVSLVRHQERYAFYKASFTYEHEYINQLSSLNKTEQKIHMQAL